MPLILDPATWTEERLRLQATHLRDGLASLGKQLTDLPQAWAIPWALEAGLNLIRQSTNLATRALEQGRAEPNLLACVANQLYEVGASLPIFLKVADSRPPPYPSRKPRPP